MPRGKGQFPCSFFILLIQCHEHPASKFTNLHIFIIPLRLNMTLFSKSHCLTPHLKQIIKQVALKGFLKNAVTYPGPSRHLMLQDCSWQLYCK